MKAPKLPKGKPNRSADREPRLNDNGVLGRATALLPERQFNRFFVGRKFGVLKALESALEK